MLKAFNENNKFKYLITAGGIVGLAASMYKINFINLKSNLLYLLK
jgi:hypothetical protein